MDNSLAFYFDSSACSGCKTCQIACKDKNDLDVGVNWRRVYEISGGDWVENNGVWISKISSYNLSMACNHCEEPICLKSCPNSAIIKNADGIVLIDLESCMGCRYCEMACPYGALQFDKNLGQMTKCNFCIDFLKEGKEPACVAACPMRVLDFGTIAELKEKYSEKENIFPMPDPKICKPSFIINPHKDAAENPHNFEIENMEELRND